MSGAARVNTKLAMPVEKWESPTTVHVNLKKHPSMEAADVGKKVHFHGHGIVRSIRKDEHEHRMEIDVKKIRGRKNAPLEMQEHD